MSVCIRMSRQGAKGDPFYKIVVANSESARDGRFLEKLGTYDPNVKNGLTLNMERIKYWLSVGAKPSKTVYSLINRK